MSQEELMQGIEPVRRSPGGEGYYSWADSLEILRRCDRMRIAASSPEAYEYWPPKVKGVSGGILALSVDEEASWDTIVDKVNSRVRAFVEGYRDSPVEILFTWVVFRDPDDAWVL